MRDLSDLTTLQSCFREIDRDDVEPLPRSLLGEAPVTTWQFGPRVFALFESNGKTLGLVFHRNPGGTPAVATMCQWCHRVAAHGAVTLLTVKVSDTRSVGQYLCRDLECVGGEQTPVGEHDMRETVAPSTRRARAIAHMRQLLTQRVF